MLLREPRLREMRGLPKSTELEPGPRVGLPGSVHVFL